MFQCGSCMEMSTPNQPMNKVVTEKRSKLYPRRYKKGNREEVEMVSGWEIVKEIPACPSCFTTLTGKEARMVDAPKPPRRFDNRAKDNRWKHKDNNFRDIRKKLPQQQQPRRQPQVQVINPLQTVKS